MAWSISDLFPPWGDSGERPSDNFQYDGGDQVNEKHLDYLWDSLRALEAEIRSALTDLDSDQDGRVDAADTSQLVKGNDIDSNADGVVDDADNVTSTYKGNDIDSNGDGTVDAADDSNTLQGSTPTEVRPDVENGGALVVSGPTAINAGTNVTASDDGDGTVTFAAGSNATTYKGNDIDTDGDGTVNNADNLGGNPPSFYNSNASTGSTSNYTWREPSMVTGNRSDETSRVITAAMGVGGSTVFSDSQDIFYIWPEGYCSGIRVLGDASIRVTIQDDRTGTTYHNFVDRSASSLPADFTFPPTENVIKVTIDTYVGSEGDGNVGFLARQSHVAAHNHTTD